MIYKLYRKLLKNESEMHLKSTILWNLMLPFGLDLASFVTLMMEAETS